MGKLRLLLLVTILAKIPACDDGVDKPINDCVHCWCDPSRCRIYDLTQREHVLLNLESAYFYRRIDFYQGALDADFTFFLSAYDVFHGQPERWDRATEIDIARKMFDKNSTSWPAQSIYMDIRTEDGLTWIESDSPLNPGEKWYTTTVYYDFRFVISPNTYEAALGSQATFTVRDAGNHRWQLVEMHDLGGNLLATENSSAAILSTLGGVKALFR